MGFFDKKVTNVTQVDQDVFDIYTPVGTDGRYNTSIGAGGYDNSNRAGSNIEGDDNFAPSFNFAPAQTSSGYTLEGVTRGLAANPTTRNDLAAMLQTSGDKRTPEQWLLANLQAGDTNSEFIAIAREGLPVGRDAVSNFGGAVQGSGLVTGGDVNGPVASGEDSIAFQVGSGVGAGGDILNSQVITAPVAGPVIGGDVIDSPVVTAPIGGNVSFGDNAPVVSGSPGAIVTGGDVIGDVVAPAGDVFAPIITGDPLGPVVSISSPISGGGISAPIAAGEDVNIDAPVIVGNQGTINIENSDREVVLAAIKSANESLNSSLEFNQKSLAVVAEAKRDPGEKTVTDSQNLVFWAILGIVVAAAAK